MPWMTNFFQTFGHLFIAAEVSLMVFFICKELWCRKLSPTPALQQGSAPPTELSFILPSYAAPYTELAIHFNLLNYNAPFWATQHHQPPELSCILLCRTVYTTKLLCTLTLTYSLLSYYGPYWATLHLIEQCCTLPHYTACTLLSYPTHNLAMLHTFELCCTILSYAAPFRATLHPTEQCWKLLS
jgi:hypothetical protein